MARIEGHKVGCVCWQCCQAGPERPKQNAEIKRLQRENAELREVLSGCTGDLASYAFSKYGHDAKLYNGIVSIQAKLAAAEAALTTIQDASIGALNILGDRMPTVFERLYLIKSTCIAAIAAAKTAVKTCTCHPSEAPVPCQQKYALTDCIEAARGDKP